MIKNIISGIIIGVSNIIPGVSGGTVIVLLGLFNKTMESIDNLFKKKTNKKESIIFLSQLAIGIIIGIVSFAKLLEIFFKYIPTQTIFWFVGMIIFSIPIFVRKEMKNVKMNNMWAIIGILLIGFLFIFSPAKQSLVISDFPNITIPFLLTLIIVGFIGGGSMIFPGISGSMILLIIGKYYLFKSYIANVGSLKLEILIPLAFIGIGILIGIVLSAKMINWLLKNYKTKTLSFIFGLILMSSMSIIPIDEKYSLLTLVTSILSLLFGGIIVTFLDKWSNKKRQ